MSSLRLRSTSYDMPSLPGHSHLCDLPFCHENSMLKSCECDIILQPGLGDETVPVVKTLQGTVNPIFIIFFNPQFAVRGVSKDSPADSSRMKYDDKVFMYVITSESEEKVQESKLLSGASQSAVNTDLAKAHAGRNSVVLFVQKSKNL